MSDEIRLETLLDPIAKASKRTSEVLVDAWNGLLAVGTLSHSNLVEEEDLATEYPGKYAFCQDIEKEAVQSIGQRKFEEAAHHLRREAFIAKAFFNPQNEITQRCNKQADEMESLDRVYKELKDADTKQRVKAYFFPDLQYSVSNKQTEIKQVSTDNQKSQKRIQDLRRDGVVMFRPDHQVFETVSKKD